MMLLGAVGLLFSYGTFIQAQSVRSVNIIRTPGTFYMFMAPDTTNFLKTNIIAGTTNVVLTYDALGRLIISVYGSGGSIPVSTNGIVNPSSGNYIANPSSGNIIAKP